MRRLMFGLLLAALSVSQAGAQPRTVRSTGVIDAVDECVTLDVSGMGTATISVVGPFVGTVTWASRVGPTAAGLRASAVGVFGPPQSYSFLPGQWVATVLGADAVQACFSAYTSGSATVTLSASQLTDDTRPPCNPLTRTLGQCRM